VHAEHRVAGEEVEEAVFQHLARAGQAFFGRLEHQVQDAVEVARGRQVARRRQQHGGVAVVAAGVHLAEHLAGPGLAAGLGDRQASMSARRPMRRVLCRARSVPTTPVPPRPRCTSQPQRCSRSATRSLVACSS
jgi:hypothetical protein